MPTTDWKLIRIPRKAVREVPHAIRGDLGALTALHPLITRAIPGHRGAVGHINVLADARHFNNQYFAVRTVR